MSKQTYTVLKAAGDGDQTELKVVLESLATRGGALNAARALSSIAKAKDGSWAAKYAVAILEWV